AGPRGGARGDGARDPTLREATAHVVPGGGGRGVAPSGPRPDAPRRGGDRISVRRRTPRRRTGVSRGRRPRAVHPPSTYLGFERPLAAVDAEIAALAGRRAQRTTAERLPVLRTAPRRVEADPL